MMSPPRCTGLIGLGALAVLVVTPCTLAVAECPIAHASQDGPTGRHSAASADGTGVVGPAGLVRSLSPAGIESGTSPLDAGSSASSSPSPDILFAHTRLASPIWASGAFDDDASMLNAFDEGPPPQDLVGESPSIGLFADPPDPFADPPSALPVFGNASSVLGPGTGTSMLGALDDTLDADRSDLGPLSDAPFHPVVSRQDPSPLAVLPSTWAGNAGGTAPNAAPFLSSPVNAPSSKNLDFEDRTYWRQGLLKRVWRDQKFLITRWAPSEVKNARFITPLLVGLASAFSGREGGGLDRSIELNASSKGTGRTRRTAHFLTSLGNGSTAAVIVGSAYLFGRWTHRDRLQETASLSAESLLDVGIWVTILKAAAGRTRPAGGGTGDFFEYRTQPGQVNGSFPSGHAMGAFAFATVIAHEYRDKRWVPWVAYGTAGLISYSRLVLHRHFASDVIVGAALGNSVGRMVWARAHGEEGSFPGRIGPIFDPAHKSYGITWSYNW